jgi:predicted lipoprotein with Yx(FWY)xxD motif
LFTALTGDDAFPHISKRTEKPAVEREAVLERRHDEIEMVDPLHCLGKFRGPRASTQRRSTNTWRLPLKRISVAVVVTAVAASTVTAVADAGATRAKLQLRKTSVGTILVNAKGFTVYAFTRDGRNKDVCVKISGCAGAWPLLATTGKALAGPGVKSSLIGTITPKSGVKQVTYAGHPLYSYSGDSGPGQTSYVNFSQFGGNWPALNAAGQEVR